MGKKDIFTSLGSKSIEAREKPTVPDLSQTCPRPVPDLFTGKKHGEISRSCAMYGMYGWINDWINDVECQVFLRFQSLMGEISMRRNSENSNISGFSCVFVVDI